MIDDNALILVINSGSSSLKFAIQPADAPGPLLSGLAECLGQEQARITFRSDGAKATRDLPAPTHAAALDALLDELAARGWIASLAAVGHRVVHGGERFSEFVLITPEVLDGIAACSQLAPLHNPPAVLGIRIALAKLPGVPHVAVIDTAFHQTMPPAAFIYALPIGLYREQGVRRYGMHGTSHRFVAQEAVRILGLDPADHGLVIAHLGNGASATAVLDGRSVDTTMGMTPLAGLVMGTRSGDVDPGALSYLGRRNHWTWDDMDRVLNEESGLLGLSGLSNDCRELEAAARTGHEGARLALDVFAYHLARAIGGLAASPRRLDAVVFTGGIGENSARVRELAIRRLGVFGIVLDETANQRDTRSGAGIISTGHGPVALVVNTNEEWMIARDTARLAREARERAGRELVVA